MVWILCPGPGSLIGAAHAGSLGKGMGIGDSTTHKWCFKWDDMRFKRIHDWALWVFDPRNLLFVGKSQPHFLRSQAGQKTTRVTKSEHHDFIAQLQLVESRTLDHTFGILMGHFLDIFNLPQEGDPVGACKKKHPWYVHSFSSRFCCTFSNKNKARIQHLFCR